MSGSIDQRQRLSRVRGCATGLLLAAAAAALPASARAGALHVAIQRLPCAHRDRIARHVERRAEEFMGPQQDLALLVSLERADALSLRLFGPHAAFERAVPFARRDCAELEDMLLLLVRGWVSREWTAPSPEPPPPPARAPVAGDLDLRSPPPAVAPAPAALEIGLLGGAFVAVPGADGGPVATLSLSRDLTAGWGAAVEFGYRGSSSTTVGSGRITARLFAVAAAARLRLRPGPALGLDLLAGPALELLAVRSEHIPHTNAITRYDAALVGAARLRLRLSDSLTWLAGLELAVRNANDRLWIDGWSQRLVVPPVRLLLLTGVALEVF